MKNILRIENIGRISIEGIAERKVRLGLNKIKIQC